MKTEPYNGKLGGKCKSVKCHCNLNKSPKKSKVFKHGRVVSSRNRNRDKPTAYSKSIKKACPNVYSWSKDDRAGMRDCRPGNGGFKVTSLLKCAVETSRFGMKEIKLLTKKLLLCFFILNIHGERR